jgi:hypothetical protein
MTQCPKGIILIKGYAKTEVKEELAGENPMSDVRANRDETF